MRSNSWSSRFGTLLCYNSVIIKVEPEHVDYFYLKYLEPWKHFVPVCAVKLLVVHVVEFPV